MHSGDSHRARSYGNATRGAMAVCALALGLGAEPAQAGTVSDQTVTLQPSGSDNNVTNGTTVTVFGLTPSFNMFNPTLGNLVSATLEWTATGSLVVGGNNEGVAILSYATSADTETWNIFGGTTTLNFSINGSESLDPASVTGSSTISPTQFRETYQLQQGFFPATFVTGPTSGTFKVEYDYLTPGQQNTIPEVSTTTYVFPSLLALWMGRRRFRKAATPGLPV